LSLSRMASPIPSLPVLIKESHSSSSFIKTLSPSLMIIFLILAGTVFVSVALCLLLRHLNRRCIRHLSTTTTVSVSATDSHRHSSRRVSPETPAVSIADSLPIFTFSSVLSRRQSSAASSVNGADCAVCLSKFESNDQLRLLPLCCHAFHCQCIDTWLASNQTCPLCRSSIHVSDSELKNLFASSNAGGNSFRLEIGSLSRRRAPSSDFGEPRSYSVGSFDYVVEDESEINVSQTHRRSVSDKDEITDAEPAMEASLAAEVGAGGRSWLRDYVDRLSSRALSFRSSGGLFSGSSRRSDIAGAGDWDMEANRAGEEISELFRWFSGV
ncbi:zf-RING_2 domain-containing protein, partial [Cephalotus follicularis]